MKKSSRGDRSGATSKSTKASTKKPVKNGRSLLEVLGLGAFARKKKADPEEDDEPKSVPPVSYARRGGIQLKTSYSARSGSARSGSSHSGSVRSNKPDARSSESKPLPGGSRAGDRSRGARSGDDSDSRPKKTRDDERNGQRGGERPDPRVGKRTSARDSQRGEERSKPDAARAQRQGRRSSGPGKQRSDGRPQQVRLSAAPPVTKPPTERNAFSGAEPSAPVIVSRGRGQGAPKLQGIIKRHPDGFGFLVVDGATHPDVYISRQYMTGIMTNDRVEAEVYSSRDDDRYFGEITSVLKRANSVVVGRYLPVDKRYGVIQDDGRGWGTDLRILAEDSLSAKEGDLVAVEIAEYPMREREFTGKVVSIIGDVEDPLNDVKRIIFSHHIPHEFGAKALAEARAYGGHVLEEEIAGRVDLRDKTLITIDGATARDFDDAICVEEEDGGFRLWVAIADVSHYVKPGTSLDQEAYERGTSTYFPNFVVPMLPEELSNDLCSINPNVARLCFVCEMRIDYQGIVQSYKFYEGVMESKARVTYGEAQEVVDGETPDRLKHVAANICRAADLARILMAKRFREGSLDLEIPETQVVVDAAGESTDVIRSQRLFAHRLIEEMMLAANVCCARFMEENDIPGIFRVHEAPKSENIETLQRFIWNFGSRESMSGGKLQKKIGAALESFVGRPEAQILNILTLRSMNQAKYSPVNIGHFGLGFSQYGHFTSPIRRYPDLIAHRLIKSVLDSKYRFMRMTQDELATATTMLSACEQRSVKAERQLVSIKKARFMQKFIGQELDGIVSSVAKFGCFVLLRAYDVDGLVKIEDLGDDRFVFDEDNLRLIGRRSGAQWAIGDPVRVVVRGADPDAGRVDFALAEEQPVRAPSKIAVDDKLMKAQPARERKRGDSPAAEGHRKRDKKRGTSDDDRGNVRSSRVSKRRRKN